MRRPDRVPPFPAALFLIIALCAAPVAAQDASTSKRTQDAPAGDAIRYRLVVEGPDPPAGAIREGLDLARWQSDQEMTLELLELLVRESIPQAREIAAIEGYYDADLQVSIDRNARPYVVTLRIDPGQPVRVAGVNIAVTGPASTHRPLGTEAIEQARASWALPLGEVFRQSAWNDAKANALRAMRRTPYAAATIVSSQARVDPAQRSAALEVAIDSGPPFAIGAIEVEGVSRYPASLVVDFSTLKRGEPYTEAALDAYVRRLAASGYFDSVHAAVDPESATPGDATVRVSVHEAPTHRFEGSLGYTTDTRFGARASYSNVNLDDQGLKLRAEARLESQQQLAKLAFIRPPRSSKWIDTLSIGAEQTDFQNTLETTAGIGVERRGLDETGHAVFGATYYYDRQEPAGAASTTSFATYVEAGYVIRRVDNLLSPTRGYMADMRVGGGIPGLSSEGFARTVALAAAWYPIDRMTQLALRAEAGGVFGASREKVPTILRFRTGGDTSVRGYAYQSLGVEEGDATVAGRYYALLSVEVIRWFNETWGIAAFVDAGNAFDASDEFSFAAGYGLGARLRTPIGPFRLDVAYGEQTRKVRLHFSVGLSF